MTRAKQASTNVSSKQLLRKMNRSFGTNHFMMGSSLFIGMTSVAPFF